MGTVSYRLCNKYGIDTVIVLAKDKKAGMVAVFAGPVPKDSFVDVSSSTGTGDYGEIELTVSGGAPYGVSWIRDGDSVDF